MMRRLWMGILLTCMATGIYAQQQKTGGNDAEVQRMDSIAMQLFLNKNYQEAADMRLKQLSRIKELYGESDSLYIETLVQLGKSYNRSGRKIKAEEAAQQVVDLYAKHHSTTNASYAYFLDNLALYQANNDKKQEALENSMQALSVYEQLGKRDYDLGIILIHVAENQNAMGQADKAVKYEIRALKIMEDLFGEHSEEYLDELPYLLKYYEGAKMDDQAERLQKRIDRLQKERDEGYGDLPEPIKFKTAEECREHNADMLRCCKYYLSHYLRAKQMSQATAYIMAWSAASADVDIVIGEQESQLLLDKKSMPYAVSYIAACCEFALTTGEKAFSEDMYSHAMVAMLNHYQANKDTTGPVPYLEKYIKAYEKGNLEKLLKRNFPKEKKK